MSAAGAVRRMLRDDQTVSEMGHRVAQLTEGLGRQMSILDKQALTVGEFLRGDYPRIDIDAAILALAEADELLKGGDAAFTMTSQTHSLVDWRGQLAGAIERARLYQRGGVSK